MSYFSGARYCLVLRDTHMGKTKLSKSSNFRVRRDKQEAVEKIKQVATSENDMGMPTLDVMVKAGAHA